MQQKKSNFSFSTIIIFIALTLVGLTFVPLLSVQLNPSTALPSLTISYYWHDASPEIIEQEVTCKLEGLFNTVKGIKKISSTSSNSKGKINILFDKHTDIDIVRFEISSIIRQTYHTLPENLSYPVISVNRPDENETKPLLTYTLNGPASPYYIQQYAEKKVKKELSLIEGIDRIEVYGATPMEWQITYNNNIIQSLSIKYYDIITALQQYFDQQSLGTGIEIKKSSDENIEILSSFSVILKNNIKNKINWSEIPVKKIDNRIIYLTDIASIKYISQKPYSYFRINGLNTIYIVIYSNKGVNNLVLAKKIKSKIQEIKTNLPTGYYLSLNYDTTKYIKKNLTRISYRTLFTIIILLLFIAIISRNLRYVLIIVISLFSNIAICFTFYYLFKIEIHLYSLAGITISLGLIIDNSIVMIDHMLYQHNKKVFLPILASTLTTIASLVVIFFLPEKLKLNLWDFSIIIIVNLTVSLFIALFLIPALVNTFQLIEKSKKKSIKNKRIIIKNTNIYGKTIKFLSHHKKIVFIIAVLSFGIPVFMLPNKIKEDKWYSNIYNKTLGNDWYIENIKPLTDKVLGGSLRLFNYYVYERANYSKKQETVLYVYASMPKGSTVQQMNNAFKQIENHLSKYKEIKQYITEIYSERDANIIIYFKKEFENTLFPFKLKGKLISKTLNLGGISWYIYGVGKGFSATTGNNDLTNYTINLYGYNYDVLLKQGNICKQKLLKHPRVRNISISSSNQWWEREKLYEYTMHIDKDKLASKNIYTNEIYSELKRLSKHNYADLSYIINNKYENIKILSKQSNMFDFWNLFHYPIYINNSVKLGDFSESNKERISSSIYKENQQYLLNIKYNYLGSSIFGNKYYEKIIKEMNKELPLGYKAKHRTWNYLIENGGKQYYLLLIIFILIYFICAILFESLSQPFAIISIIPLSFIGIFLTFYLFDFDFDQGGFASFFLLSGLVVNSSIYILNEYNILKRKYKSYHITNLRIYLKAFNNKIVPVLLTIISTILGFLPFIIFGQKEPFWFPLGVGSIGGLIFSIFTILVYLPLFLKLKNK